MRFLLIKLKGAADHTLERDQQGDDPNEAITRALKNRHAGKTGVCDTLAFKPKTGRLLPKDKDCPFDVEEDEFA